MPHNRWTNSPPFVLGQEDGGVCLPYPQYSPPSQQAWSLRFFQLTATIANLSEAIDNGGSQRLTTAHRRFACSR